LRYDSTSEGDLAWQLGLGCQGVVDVLVERLKPRAEPTPLDWLRHWLAERRCGVLARVAAVAGNPGVDVGAFLACDETGLLATDLDGGSFQRLIAQTAMEAYAGRRSYYTAYELADGKVELFYEVVQPPLSLLVCGAGHDAMPLVRMAKELGWHVTVLDPRPNYATRERFPLADALLVAGPEELLPPVPERSLRPLLSRKRSNLIDQLPLIGSAAVIMSHHYHNDRFYLQALLPSALRYLGILGPRARTDRLLDELAQGGCLPNAEQTARLYGPIGLDLGANTPEEIALAVTAEIQAVLAGRSGAFLRSSDRPIHERAGLEAEYLLPAGEKGHRACLLEAK
jgi:xanthine dehydrogenase accessory factor